MNKFFQKVLSRVFKGTQLDSPRYPWIYSGKTVVNEDSSMQVSSFHRGITYISSSVSSLPWYVKDKDKKILWDDKITTLLDLAPNSEMSSMQFRICMIITAIIYGNAYAEIERDFLGRPIALWPINPMDVAPYRLNDGTLIYIIQGGSKDPQYKDAYLNPKDIFHLKNLHTKDGILGMGVVQYASETLGISLGGDRFANGLFTNAGIPSGYLTVEGGLSDEALKRLKQGWEENYSGRKVGGTAILEEGTKYETISIPPDALQFLESRKFSVYEVARFLSVPPAKLFAEGAATYNNIEHTNLEVVIDVISWWSKNFEQEADRKLLNNRHSGRRTELNIYEIFRGDMNTRSQYFSRQLQNGAISPNEIRDEEGYAPYKGGDRYFIPSNNLVAIDRMDEMIDATIESKTKSLAPATSSKPDQEEDMPEEDDIEESNPNAELEKELLQASIDLLRK
jgi:HK97 family phage portal protein